MNEFYAGGFLHAYDIRTLSSGVCTLDRQAELVNSFTDERFFLLNIQKCKIVRYARCSCNKNSVTCEEGGCQLSVNNVGKFLWHWWNDDLLVTKCVDDNIKNLRINLFHY